MGRLYNVQCSMFNAESMRRFVLYFLDFLCYRSIEIGKRVLIGL